MQNRYRLNLVQFTYRFFYRGSGLVKTEAGASAKT